MSEFSKSTVSSIPTLICSAQAELALSDRQLATALGYGTVTPVEQIKKGAMRLPITKVTALAAALQLPPLMVLRAAYNDTDPGALHVIEDVFNPLRLSATEVNLIGNLRKRYGNRDFAPIVFDGQGIIALVA